MTQVKDKYDKISAVSDYKELYKIRDFVKIKAEVFGFNENETNNICLAVDEACSNLIRHAFKFDKKRKFYIEIESLDNDFIINIIDKGNSFNPLEVTLPNMKEYFAELKCGGLGIKIMRSLMDDIAYYPSTENNPHNILRLMKILHSK